MILYFDFICSWGFPKYLVMGTEALPLFLKLHRSSHHHSESISGDSMQLNENGNRKQERLQEHGFTETFSSEVWLTLSEKQQQQTGKLCSSQCKSCFVLGSTLEPCLVWLSGLNSSLWTKGSPIGFLVRAHAWVVGQGPNGGLARGNHTLMILLFSFSLHSPLSKNK